MRRTVDFREPADIDPIPGTAPFPRLVGDVGGTHARFGVVGSRGEGVTQIREAACDDHASSRSRRRQLSARDRSCAPAACAIAIADAR